NSRAKLWRQRKIFPREPKLAKKPDQGAFLRALRRIVRDGVQSDVVIAAPETIERIQAADRIVPLQNADPLLVIGQADASRQTGETGADDDRVVRARTERRRDGGKERNSSYSFLLLSFSPSLRHRCGFHSLTCLLFDDVPHLRLQIRHRA